MRILEAARALFCERGNDVQIEEVARAAGVGIGTLYRHFPTKEAMIEATADLRFEESVEFARCQTLKNDDPWDALVQILHHCGEGVSRDRGFCMVVETMMGSNEPNSEFQAQFEEVVSDLLQRGQAAGSIRPEILPSDMYAVSCALAAVIRYQSGDWRRFLDIILEGLHTH
jgi:AcrR family transcriptional regulator